MTETKKQRETFSARLLEPEMKAAMAIKRKREETSFKPVSIAAVIREALFKLYREEMGKDAEK